MTTVDTTVRDVDLERWLDEHDVAFTLAEVALADIDLEASTANQPRLSGTDEETIARYAADYARGDHFPPLVVWRGEAGLVLVGGNHRTPAAIRAKRTTHGAYLLDTQPDAATLHLLAIFDNRRHGRPLTEEEMLWHAVSLTQDGYTTAEAARICGLPAAKVTQQLSANRATLRAIRLDIDGWMELSKTTRALLSRLEDDEVFVQATELVAGGSVLASEVADVVARLNDQPTTRGKLAYLGQLEEDSRGRTRRPGGNPGRIATRPRLRLLGELDVLLRFTPEAVAGDCQTPHDAEVLRSQLRLAGARIIAIDKAVAQRGGR